jgi:hypothetical protein
VSKSDAQRALREANFARRNAAEAERLPKRAAEAKHTPACEPEKAQAARPSAVNTPSTIATEPLCGHRNMGGKKCSRPAGHAEKNHRYK